MIVTIPELRKVATRRRFLIGSVAAGAGALAAMAAADSGFNAPRARAQEVPQDPPLPAAPVGETTQSPEARTILIEDSLRLGTTNLAKEITSSSGLNTSRLTEEGNRLSVTGKASVTATGASLGQAFKQVVVKDTEYRLEIKPDTALSRLRFTAAYRTQPDGRNGYYLAVEPNKGVVHLMKLVDGRGSVLNQTTLPSGRFIPDDWNAVSIKGEGSHLAVLVNDAVAVEGDDPDFTTGYIGYGLIRTGSIEDNQEVSVVVRNLRAQATAPDSPVAQIAAPRSEQRGPILFVDDFSNINSGFGHYRDEVYESGYDPGNRRYYIINHGIKGGFISMARSGEMENVDVEVEALLEKGKANNTAVGLGVRSIGIHTGYVLMVNPQNKRAGLLLRNPGGYSELIPFKGLASIQDSNRLRVVCEGNRLRAFVNGEYLGETAVDPNSGPPSGKVFLQLYSKPEVDVKATFANLVARELVRA